MSDHHDLFRNGFNILKDREIWEERQRKWYLMRHEGIRRRNKPFPSAADLHLKLIDEKVNQKKAFTMATVLGQPRLASFVSMRSQPQPVTESATDFFSFELKERTNFYRVLLTAVDTMWLRGRGIIRAFVDPYDDYRIIHENIDPLYLLMPDDVNDFEDSYEWVHVRQMNVQQFKNNRRYCTDYRNDDGELDSATCKKLCGGADAVARLTTQRGRDFEMIQLDKELREGYTHSGSSDTIIIWEHYKRTMGGVWVYYYCPVALDVKIRPAHGIPYKVKGRVSPGFFSFVAEVKDEGWYAPRGIAEKIADNEIYGCKAWNAKADAMTFLTTPQYISEVGVQNPANYRVAPGEVLPPGIKPAIFGAPPMSLDQEIAFTRMEADLSTQSIDLGAEHPNNGRGHSKKTATQTRIDSGIAQIGQQLESHTFRDDLAKLYRHDWGLMLQFKRKEVTFFISDDLQELPEQAMHEEYAISAGGASDDWDKNARLQKAEQRYQLLLGKPNVDQDELVTELLGADDPRLIKKLVIPQKLKAQSEAADENTIINDLCPGPNRPSLPIPVLPGQDHFVRAQTCLQWMDAAGKMNTPMSMPEKQRLMDRLKQHVDMLKKINPEQYKQLEQMIMQMEHQAQQPRQLPPGAAPMQPQGMTPRPMEQRGKQPMRMI